MSIGSKPLARLFAIAFPPECCPFADFLRLLPPGTLPSPPNGPGRPYRGAGMLHEGALLYEIAGEPVSAARIA